MLLQEKQMEQLRLLAHSEKLKHQPKYEKMIRPGKVAKLYDLVILVLLLLLLLVLQVPLDLFLLFLGCSSLLAAETVAAVKDIFHF